MKKSINILFFFAIINAIEAVDSATKEKFKADSQSFSKSIDITKSKSGRKSKDDIPVTSSKKKSDSFFSSLFESKSKDSVVSNNAENKVLSKKPKTKKKSESNLKYEDPFGAMGDVFDHGGKAKLKADRQVGADAKKKAGLAKAAEAKKKKDAGIFGSFGDLMKSGAKSIAKSDLGKQLGSVLKDSAVSIATTAITTGASKLNDKVQNVNDTIAGVKKEESAVVDEAIVSINVPEIIKEGDEDKIIAQKEEHESIAYPEKEEEENFKAFSDKLDANAGSETHSQSTVVMPATQSLMHSGGASGSKSHRKKAKRKTKSRKR